MKPFVRRAAIAFALVIGLLLAVVFGRYPATGVPADTVKLEVRENPDGAPILSLAREADIAEARSIAGTVWAGPLVNNSLDGPGKLHLTFTGKDGTEKSNWTTFTEWGDDARMPKGFMDFLDRKYAEQGVRRERISR